MRGCPPQVEIKIRSPADPPRLRHKRAALACCCHKADILRAIKPDISTWLLQVASSFTRRYMPADVALLAEMDREMDTLSGPAMCCILRRIGDSGHEQSTARSKALLVHSPFSK